MAEKLIISTLEPVGVGDDFPSLPLHITLMPWFEIEQENVPELERYLGTIASKRDVLNLIGQDIAMYGKDNTIKVRELTRTPELVRVHADISAVIAWSHGKRPADYIHENYSPHVSFTDGVSIDEGEVAKVDAFQLVDRDSETKERTIERVFPFGAPLKSDTKA